MLPSRLELSRVLKGTRHYPRQYAWSRPAALGLSRRRLSGHYRHGAFHLGQRPSCGLFRVGTQIRGKKTKTVVSLDDLPQGVIRSDALQPLEEEPPTAPGYPTVLLQARRNMQKFDNCVLLTRVGGFYELYFEHADECGPLLNLKVAHKKTAAGPVPMVITDWTGSNLLLLSSDACRSIPLSNRRNKVAF